MKNITAKTIQYYERNADGYVHETMNCDFTDIEKRFCKYIKPGGNILDVGCGSGRDAKYFIEKGYQVTAFDGSEVIYVSFKYGTRQEIRDGRYYTDLTEKSLEKVVSKLHELEVIEMFRSDDVLRDRKQQWLNAILKKVDDKY